MKLLRTTALLAGISILGIFSSGCYTSGEIYEPAGVQIYPYDGYYNGIYDGDSYYYYGNGIFYGLRTPRDDRRWEPHREFRGGFSHGEFHRDNFSHGGNFSHGNFSHGSPSHGGGGGHGHR